MNNILKITLVGVAALAFSTANAQNALQKKEIRKAEATSAVKTQSVATQSVERNESTPVIQAQPAQVKQAPVGQPKSPAQMSSKPLQKKMSSRNNQAVQPKSTK